MRSSVWLFTALAIAALLLFSACGDGDDGGATATPGDTSANGDATTAPPPDGNGDGDGDGGNGDTGSAIITFFGDVDGALELTGMSCDLFTASDSVSASISGNIDGESYTLDVGAQQGETFGRARLSRGGATFGTWDNDVDFEPDPASGSVTFTESGGEVEYTLDPADVEPGTAAEQVTVAGSWSCPGGEYAPFDG